MGLRTSSPFQTPPIQTMGLAARQPWVQIRLQLSPVVNCAQCTDFFSVSDNLSLDFFFDLNNNPYLPHPCYYP